MLERRATSHLLPRHTQSLATCSSKEATQSSGSRDVRTGRALQARWRRRCGEDSGCKREAEVLF